jgi:hypothetical protein
MPTAYYAEYVTLGSLLGGSRGVRCFDWSDLMSPAPRRSNPFVRPGFTGVIARTTVEDALTAVTEWRLDGAWTQDNATVTESSRRSTLYSHIAALQAACEVAGTQTLTLTRPGGGPHSADAQVQDIRGPKPVTPHIVEFAVVLLLPDGALL